MAPALFACVDPATAPGARPLAAPELKVDAGPRANAALASVTWQATARALIATHPTFSPITAARLYALHAVAQYGGLVAADFGGGRAQFEIRRGAVAGASVQLLSFIFPDAAVLAVRQVTDARTEEQRAIANYWNQGAGTPSTAGSWLAEASDLIVTAGLDEREAAHLLALTSAAMVDASIGCFDAKYHNMLLRPSPADPLITRPAGLPTQPYGLPNHPSYPSGHSCLSAAAVTVLSAYFPAHRVELHAQMEQAGMSRIYGGLHYFFDVDAGQDLGRDVALWATAYDRDYGLLTAIRQP